MTSFPAAVEGAFLVRLSFDDRNLTFEAPDKKTCEQWIQGFEALIQERRHLRPQVESIIRAGERVGADVEATVFSAVRPEPRNGKIQEE